jgi:hypothetical protein
MIAVPPSAAVLVSVNPGGIVPDCNSNVTLPADSGSVALTEKDTALPPVPVPIEPADVTNTGDASIVNASALVVVNAPAVVTLTSNGSLAVVQCAVFLATTQVNCVAEFLVTLSKDISVPPLVTILAVTSEEKLVPVIVNV